MIRDFTYVDDIVESLIRLINKPITKDQVFDYIKPDPGESWSPYKIFNIGNSNPTNLMDYISEIEAHIGTKAQKEFLPMQPGDVKSTYSDTSKLEKYIDFKPKTSVKEGISKFVEWYREFYNK